MKVIRDTIKSLAFLPIMLSLLSAVFSNKFVWTINNLLDKNITSGFIIIGGTLLMFIVIVLALYGLRYIIRTGWLIRVRERKFLSITVLIAAVFGLASIFIIDSKLFSDFQMYHDHAQEIISGKIPLSEVFDNLHNVYLRRALVNLVPIYALFGPYQLAVQLVNLVLHIVTGLMLFSFIKDGLKSILVARVTLIFFFSVPVAYLTLNIPSHDITGVFYLMLAFFIFGKMFTSINRNEHILKILVLSFLAGFLAFVLDLSRSIGAFFFYALILLMLIYLTLFIMGGQGKDSRTMAFKKILFLFLIPLFTYYVLKNNMISAGINKGRFIMMFVASDTSPENKGAYVEIADYKIYYNLINRDERAEMALGKYASELHHNFNDYLGMLLRKNNRFTRVGEDFSWAQTGGRIVWPIVASHWIFSIIWRVILFLLAVFGLMALYKRRILETPFMLVLLMWLVTLLLMIFLSEVSPRYAYLFLLCLPVLSALGFLYMPSMLKQAASGLKDKKKVFTPANVRFAFALSAALLILILFFSTVMKSFEKPELVYKDLRKVVSGEAPYLEAEEFSINRDLTAQARPLKFGLSIKEYQDTSFAYWHYPAEAGKKYQVRGFLRQMIERPGGLKALVMVNGRNIIPEDMHTKKLKVLKSYEVGYFSSSVTALEDTLTVALVLENTMDTALSSAPGQPHVFLEFLQIVEKEREQEP